MLALFGGSAEPPLGTGLRFLCALRRCPAWLQCVSLPAKGHIPSSDTPLQARHLPSTLGHLCCYRPLHQPSSPDAGRHPSWSRHCRPAHYCSTICTAASHSTSSGHLPCCRPAQSMRCCSDSSARAMLQAAASALPPFPAAGQATNPALAGSELPSQQPPGEQTTGAGIKVEPLPLALWNLDRIDQRELPLNGEYRQAPLHSRLYCVQALAQSATATMHGMLICTACTL